MKINQQLQGYTTARTLLSILRLSEALARLRWADQVVPACLFSPITYSLRNLNLKVVEDDVNEALRLMKMSKVTVVVLAAFSLCDNVFLWQRNRSALRISQTATLRSSIQSRQHTRYEITCAGIVLSCFLDKLTQPCCNRDRPFANGQMPTFPRRSTMSVLSP